MINVIIALAMFFVPGLIISISTLANWNWFFQIRYTQPIVRILGRDGARILYGAIGAMSLVAGAAIAFA